MSMVRRSCIAFTTFSVGAIGVLAQVATQPASAPTSQPVVDVDALRAAYAVASDRWPAATWDGSIAPADRHELASVPDVEFPADNPFSQAKSDLGWQLFFDPRLSGSTAVACASCHHPDLGWADGKVTSQGHQLQPLDRNAPTVMGTAFAKHFMWDGRADSLEDQALLPLVNSREMHGDFGDVEKTLNAIPEYRSEFKKVFGEDQITIKLVARALATFERSIVPGRSRFDLFLAGKVNSLKDPEIRGLHLFRTKARCINCHNGPLMTDGEFHNVGLTFYGRKFQDLGRYNETHDPKDVGSFKTPTLRNVGRTSPYMHNGLFELQGLINLYNAGMPNEKAPPGDPLAPHKSALLKPLQLTALERSDLLTFLRDALEEPRLRVRTPYMPGLYGSGPTTAPTTAPATRP
jgi:cytochrome c peroxidase